MNIVAVLPWVYEPWLDRCAATMSDDLWSSTLFIDNSVHNRGVAASWNEGIDAMRARGADWLVILSAAMRFGPPGGDDFIAALDDHPDALAVEAGHGLGWHCIAFPRATLDRVGRFDPIFPAYLEDIDYGRRIKLASPEIEPPYWVKVQDLDLGFAGFAHGIDLAGVKVDYQELLRSYVAKWGGDKGEERFEHPYDDARLDWTYIGEYR